MCTELLRQTPHTRPSLQESSGIHSDSRLCSWWPGPDPGPDSASVGPAQTGSQSFCQYLLPRWTFVFVLSHRFLLSKELDPCGLQAAQVRSLFPICSNQSPDQSPDLLQMFLWSFLTDLSQVRLNPAVDSKICVGPAQNQLHLHKRSSELQHRTGPQTLISL